MGEDVDTATRHAAMRTKILTLAYTPSLGAFDDSPLTDFVCDKEVLSLREYYFEVHGLPHLLCVVDYADATLSGGAVRTSSARSTEAHAAGVAAHGREDAVPQREPPLEPGDRRRLPTGQLVATRDGRSRAAARRATALQCT